MGRISRFDGLLPSNTVIVEASASMWVGGLLPEEEASIRRAVPKRVREFTAGRNCARQALAVLGFPPVAIPVGPSREPVFPTGVCGTITHTDDYCAAAVVRAGAIISIGMDAESNTALEDNLLAHVASSGEREMLTSLAALQPGVHWGKALFCMKEAFYKAYYPIAAHFLEFREAVVSIDAASQTFMIGVCKVETTPYFRTRRFFGRFSISSGVICTAVALPREIPGSD